MATKVPHRASIQKRAWVHMAHLEPLRLDIKGVMSLSRDSVYIRRLAVLVRPLLELLELLLLM